MIPLMEISRKVTFKGGWEVTANGQYLSQGDGNILKLGHDNGYNSINILKITDVYI